MSQKREREETVTPVSHMRSINCVSGKDCYNNLTSLNIHSERKPAVIETTSNNSYALMIKKNLVKTKIGEIIYLRSADVAKTIWVT